jgi:hypothetical protein
MVDIAALYKQFAAASDAATKDGSADNLRLKGEMLLNLAQQSLLEAAETFRQGLKIDPNNQVLKTRLDEALHKGKGSKVDSIMEKMDSGIARCMQLVHEIRKTASRSNDALLPQTAPAIGKFLSTKKK